MENIDSRPTPSPPTSPSTFFTPLLISMLGIVFTSMAIIVYHFILVKYCKSRPETSGGAESQPAPEGQQGKGVEDKVLETIPILPYSTEKGNQFRVDQTECVICLGELEDGEVVRLLPNCRHAFHVTCIDKWFMAHTSCPVCRSPIVAPVTPVLVPLHACVIAHENHDVDASTSAVQRGGLLRHCVSMVLPMERKSENLVMLAGLKRSLSMDHQSHHVINVDIQRESEAASSSSSSSSKPDLMRSISSFRPLDSVSSKLLGSFSRLRMGRGSEANEILPC